MPDPIQGVDSAGSFNTMLRAPYATPQIAAPDSQPQSDSGADSADVTKTLALLASIVAAANNIPIVDQARVASLQQAVASGTIEADPSRIARSFTELEGLLA